MAFGVNEIDNVARDIFSENFQYLGISIYIMGVAEFNCDVHNAD